MNFEYVKKNRSEDVSEQGRSKDSIKPPSHSDKDHKDRTEFLKLDKAERTGRNAEKKTQFLSLFCVLTTPRLHVQLRFVACLITTSFGFLIRSF